VLALVDVEVEAAAALARAATARSLAAKNVRFSFSGILRSAISMWPTRVIYSEQAQAPPALDPRVIDRVSDADGGRSILEQSQPLLVVGFVRWSSSDTPPSRH